MLKRDEIKLLQRVYDILVDNGLDQQEGIKTTILEFGYLIKRENREKKKRSQKSMEYQKNNKEKRSKYQKEYMKKYYQENRDKYIKYGKEYYKKKRNERLLNELEDA